MDRDMEYRIDRVNDSRPDGTADESRLDRAKEKLSAGASQLKEVSRNVASDTRQKAAAAARVVREAEIDDQLNQSVRSSTERNVARAGDKVSGAAPTVGRGAEYAVDKVGAAIRFMARPLGAILGPIAGTVGGWWSKAAELRSDLTNDDESACRQHFATVTVIDGMSFDDARNGYVLGYLAGCNPDYNGRAFEDVEPDLRHGFAEADDEYDALREYARFGYTRGISRGTGA